MLKRSLQNLARFKNSYSPSSNITFSIVCKGFSVPAQRIVSTKEIIEILSFNEITKWKKIDFFPDLFMYFGKKERTIYEQVH